MRRMPSNISHDWSARYVITIMALNLPAKLRPLSHQVKRATKEAFYQQARKKDLAARLAPAMREQTDIKELMT